MADVTPAKEYIIVAEDSAPNRTILVHLLNKLGFTVFGCEDGEQAWKALNENREKRIVAVISDIMMPNMDGLELLRRIRNDDGFSSMPVVLVTAVSDKDYIYEARNLKVNGYILKPLTLQRVMTKLEEIFPNRSFPKLTG